MADSLNQKSPKSGDKSKSCNVLHRTTSETIRLGEPEKHINPPPTSLTSGTTSIRKKAPSFQITSVTVNSRMSNDGGDDSADDLDESHTEDNSDVIDSSKITDIENETPSFSEDTFSKDDIFFNPSAASLGTAPVIPTSSQYGLAIVSEGGGGAGVTGGVPGANAMSSGVTCSDLHVSVSDNVININTKSEERDTVTNRNERFKVVKIESTEPFKRGRWVCMDFLDHSNTSSSIAKDPVGKEDNLVCGVPSAVGESVVDPTITVGDVGIVPGVDFTGVKSTLHDHRNPPGGPGPPSGLPPHLAGFTQLPPHQSMPGMGPLHAPTQQYYQPAQSVGVAGFEQATGPNTASVQTLQPIHHPQQPQQVPQTQPGVVTTTQGQSMVGMVQQQPQMPNGTTTAGMTVGSTVSTQTSMGTGHGVLPSQQQSMVQGMPLSQQQQQQQQVHTQPIAPQASGYVAAPQPNIAQQQQGNIGPFIHMQQQPTAIPQVGQQQPMTQQQTQQHQHPQQHQQPQHQPQHQAPQQQHQQHPTQAQGGYMTVQQPQQNLVPQQQQQQQAGMNQQHQPHPGYVTGQPVPQKAMGQPGGFVQTAGQSLQNQANYMPQVKPPSQPQSQQPVQGFMPQQPQTMQPPQQHPQTQQQPSAYMGVPSQGQPSPQQQQQAAAAFMAQQQVPPGQSQPNAQVITSSGQSQPAPQQMAYMATQPKPQPASMPHQPAYIQQPPQGPQVGFVNSPASVSQQPGQSYQHSLSHHPQQEQGIMNEDASIIGVDHHVEAKGSTPSNGGIVPSEDCVPVAISQVAPVVVPSAAAQGGAEEAESASGTSAVAIDNKIEQAMDLVKSHLMFAVREEVEVLKEKIAELMERINQLEAENSILKANASTETLAQLGGGGQAQAS
ncbi:protein bunched, class 2/F/G isoform-like isoform X2 [Ischnura elegans]|uniref:protein bunched, class 2/F/G isoform-like isoform X2 n=1 Tax=Ischnura elegans TaxID=197161 RepID=UPI001ED89CFB|nr:protein bunched, class 2/F/G isoform-like isoform X2 [Ischnura elegans]